MYNFILSKEQRDIFIAAWKVSAKAKKLTTDDNLEYHIFHSAVEDIESKIFKAFTAHATRGNVHSRLYYAINSLTWQYKYNKRKLPGGLELTPDQVKQIQEFLGNLAKKV